MPVGTDGAFAFQGLPDGRYTLALVIRPTGQVLPPQFHVEAGRTDLRLQLEAPSFVAGQVVDADGKPVRAAVRAAHDGVHSGSPRQDTDAEGRFRLEVPSTFRGRVFASLPDARTSSGEVRDVVAGQLDLRVVLAGPELRR
jgi:hypothetical protein